MLDPQPTLVELLVRHVRLPREILPQIEINSILYAALDPTIASKARKGDFVRWMDHFDLLQTAIN
jgi:hypothetical protein